MNKFSFEKFKNSLSNLQPLAKGWRGYIFTANYNGEKIAIKIPRDKIFLKPIQTEIENLILLQSFPFVPKLVAYGYDFFAYKFIEGIHFDELLKNLVNNSNFSLIRKIIIKILDILYFLDIMGVQKNELIRPNKNILISENRIYLIDFEKARINKFLTNIPQFLQFLKKVKIYDMAETIKFGKDYKLDPEKTLKKIKETIDVTKIKI